jgi:hypothetical protein
MSYRCGVCTALVPEGQSLVRHTEYRTGGRQIAREYPVCHDCRRDLDRGLSLEAVRDARLPRLLPLPPGKGRKGPPAAPPPDLSSRPEVIPAGRPTVSPERRQEILIAEQKMQRGRRGT